MPNRRQLIVFASLIILGSTPRLFAGATTQPSSTPDDFLGPVADLSFSVSPVLCDDDDDDKQPASTSPSGGRYFFNLLDSRSSYGKDFFHDPLQGPEFDVEKQIELNYFHGEKRGVQDDDIDAEFQWNVIGELMIAGGFGWDSNHQANPLGGAGDEESQAGTGFESVDLAIYHPIFQYVSEDRFIDYTADARVDVGIPTRTAISGNDAQLTPYLGHLLRIGDSLSLEAWTGSQFTFGPNQINQLIYGASFGYVFSHEQLPLPLTDTFTPIIELDGQRPFSGGGQDALFGIAGFELCFKTPGDIQPCLQIGYQFPLDQGARDELEWGVITSVKLQF